MQYLTRCLWLLLLPCLVTPAGAATRYTDLDQWLARDLLPFVRRTLSEHPRFRGESLRFVVMENGSPQALSNGLALQIRDRVREAAADIPGVRIAWQPDDSRYVGNAGPGRLDCTQSEVHYLVGIEAALTDTGLLSVDLRALDVEDRTLVADFSRNWQGRITSSQYRAFRRSATDPMFRGERAVPYDESQSDLLAAHLAHDLGCSLLRQTDAEYVITEAAGTEQAATVGNMAELVGNNLAQYSALQFTASAAFANAVIEAKAHRIDDDLYQYWVTVQAKDPASELAALSASAYVRLPDKFARAEPFTEPAPALQSVSKLLDSLRIVTLAESRACPAQRPQNSRSGYGVRHPVEDCYALQVRARDDAVVFFLNHQQNHGLVRLADASCARQTSARIARSGEYLQFPLPQDSLPTPAWSPGAAWELEPDLDTYYAVAASDTQAARALSQHIAALPMRCGGSIRPGLEGQPLRAWLSELQSLTEQWGPSIDWQTLRVKNVY